MENFTLQLCVIINKYFGFEQLKFLNDVYDIDCVKTEEIRIDNINDLDMRINRFGKDALYTVRTASISGIDFGMPSEVKCNKETAKKWIIKKLNDNPNYAAFISRYFKSNVCGRIQMNYSEIKIDITVGDFKEFSKGYVDLILTKKLNDFYMMDKRTEKADGFDIYGDPTIDKIIIMANKLYRIYKVELEELYGSTYDFDFVFGAYEDMYGNCGNEFFKLISMRTYLL